MNKIIIGILVLSLIVLSGCINPYQTEINKNQLGINTHLIDSANIDKLNSCGSGCEGLKCLCDTMVSENHYCERYENSCVNNVCEEIMININDVNFLDEIWETNEKYFDCQFIYENIITIEGIELKEINDETLRCLAEFKKNQTESKGYHVYYYYANGRFIDEYGLSVIKCGEFE